MMLHNRLKVARVTFGNLTQQGLAELVGCSRQTINSIENSKFVPSVALALTIAKVLEQKLEDIFYLQREEDGHS